MLLFVCTRLRSRLDHCLPVSVASNLSSGHVDEALVVYTNEAEKTPPPKKKAEKRREGHCLKDRAKRVCRACHAAS